ncbi:MAG: RNA polymerase sigma factor [Gemmatimonadaceae bacterium]
MANDHLRPRTGNEDLTIHCHMDAALTALISNDTTFQPRTDAMDQCDLERELGLLHPESWGWALACCGRDRDLAEDVLQTAYVSIISRRALFNGDSTLKTWVFGVIRWTALGERRRQLFWKRRHVSATAAEDFVDSARGADETVEQSDLRARLIHALNDLSRRQREVLQLVFYHGLTINEAAGVMSVSLGSARTHYERGKKALAQKLGDEDHR